MSQRPRKLTLSDKFRKFFNLGKKHQLEEVPGKLPGSQHRGSEAEVNNEQRYSVQAVAAAPRSSSSSALSYNDRPSTSEPCQTGGSKQSISVASPAPPTQSVQQAAASSVSNGSLEVSMSERHGFLHGMLYKLKSGDWDQKAAAAEALFNYTAEDDVARQRLSSMGVVQPLVDLLRNGTDTGKMYAAYTLSSLTSIEVSRQDMKTSGAIPALLAVLCDSQSMLVCKKGAMRALGRLARNDDAAVEIVRLGGLPPTINLLSSSDASLVRRCLIALYFIGADKEMLQLEISNAGAVPHLISLCHSDNSDVQAEAADVLKVLAKSHACGQVIAREAGLEVLGHLALSGLTERCKASAQRALQRLYDNPALKDLILRSGTVAAVEKETEVDEVRVLADLVVRGDRWVREKAAEAIETATADDPTASKDLAAAGVIEPLVDLLHRGTEEGRANAARALARMADEGAVRERIYAAGGVAHLFRAITELRGQGQAGAVLAVERMAQHREAAAWMTQHGCTRHLVQVVLEGGEVLQASALRALLQLVATSPSVLPQLHVPGFLVRLVQRCWRSQPRDQMMALKLKQLMIAQSKNPQELAASGVLPLLATLQGDQNHDLAAAAHSALDRFVGLGLLQPGAVEQEMALQSQISAMLAAMRTVAPVPRTVEEAFRMVPRALFLPEGISAAYSDEAIHPPASGSGCSVEAPHVAAVALEALALQPGHRVLDAGCGSGFFTCLAAYLVAPKGKVLGVEVDPVLCDSTATKAQLVCTARGLSKTVHEFQAVDVFELLEYEQQYDRIHVGASISKAMAEELTKLLAPGGHMVAPVHDDLMVISKEGGFSTAKVVMTGVVCDALLCGEDDCEAGDGTGDDGGDESQQHLRDDSATAAAGLAGPRPSVPGAAPDVQGGKKKKNKYRSDDVGPRDPALRAIWLQRNGRKEAAPRTAQPPQQSAAPDEGSPGSGSRPASAKPSSRSPQVAAQASAAALKERQESHDSASASSSNGDISGLLLKDSDIVIARNSEGKKCRLGEGGFGIVYKAIMNGVDEVAVKLVKNDNPTPKERELFVKEVAILSKLHHRNIVQFYGACLESGNMFFVTELMKGGDLYSALRHHPDTMRWGRLGKKVALDVALGINYLHSQKPPMMHRDLKSPNVLLSEEGVAKIADVGMVRAQVKELVTAQPVMTPLWAAPEVMRHDRASIKADIWSYGVLIWELVSGEDITEYQPLAISRQLGPSKSGSKVIVMPEGSPSIADLIFTSCTKMDAAQRPTAQQIVEWLRTDRGD